MKLYKIIALLCIVIFSCSKESTKPDSVPNFGFSFDGIDDCVFVPVIGSPLDTLNNSFTIEAKILVRSYPNIAPRILDRTDSDRGAPYGDRVLLALFEPDSCISLNVNGYVVKSGKIPLNEWIHIHATFSVGEMSMYVNGTKENTINIITQFGVTDSDLTIGNNSPLNNRQFDGLIDEIKIWDHCLSWNEIISNYNEESRLLAYWDFNQESIQEVIDKSENHLDGINGETAGVDTSDAEQVEIFVE